MTPDEHLSSFARTAPDIPDYCRLPLLEFAQHMRALRAAAALAYFALCEEAAAYEEPIDHVIKGRDALAPFFPHGADCRGERLGPNVSVEPQTTAPPSV